MDQDPSTGDVVLRGASDGLLVAIREVDARERIKRGVRPGATGFLQLARDVRFAAEALLLLAREEEQRAAEDGRAERNRAALATIERTEPAQDLAAILAEWRTVERSLEGAGPGSTEEAQLMTRFTELRDRYQAALKAHQDRD